MSESHRSNELNDFEDIAGIYPIRNMATREKRNRKLHPQNKTRPSADEILLLAQQTDDFSSRELTYDASRHEREWIESSLGDFFEHQWLDDILRLIKGGKEANVYHCLANSSVKGLTQPFLAAKVYRPRRFRNLKNDHVYREGRIDLDGDGNQITDDGMLHAMRKKTGYGRELLHTSWIEHEVKTMQLLHAAGADVPQVFTSEDNAILMTYIGDEELAAPILYGIRLENRIARNLFDRVVFNLELMLAHQRVHGDLSAFNILYWDGEMVIIDFPQAIDPGINRNAYWIFERDVVRICEYFARQGVKSDGRELARSLWKAQHLRVVPDVHPAMLNIEDEADRSYWQRWQEEG